MIATVSDQSYPSNRRRTNVADPLKVDRLPPHAIEAEQGVLGCILIDPTRAGEKLGETIDALPAGSKTFYDLRLRTIYELMVEMWQKKEQTIDLITIQQRLKDRQQIEAVGGLPYLASLPDAVPSASNIDYYLAIIREKFLLRQMVQVCTEIVGRVYEWEGDDLNQFMDQVEKDILAINTVRSSHTTAPIKELVRSAIRTIEEMHERKGAIGGIPTGFIDYDKMTDGLHPAEMIVVAGRPSTGKSSLAMNIVEHVAIDQKLPVGVFSLEMTAESLVLRGISSRARMNLRNIREGFLAERDFPKLTNAAGKYASAPIYIDDTPGLNILQMRAKARRLWQQYGVKLFVVDYLQLVSAISPNARNREREVADISYGIKNLAKELRVPVIVLSQLNREVDKNKGRKPRMSDLRESGAVEQDADIIGLLYKADPENRRKALVGEDDDDSGRQQEAIPVNINIDKNRNGPTGDVHLTFLKSITRFESAARVSPTMTFEWCKAHNPMEGAA